MEELNLEKDISIITIVKRIISHFGEGFFETYISDHEEKLIDFWEADLLAIGLKRKQNVIYISTWNFRDRDLEDMKYFVEFELIDEETLEQKECVKEIDGISGDDLLREIKHFVD
jgi:hypothetical protein